jgi:signal transduction histidine kinase
LTRILRELVSNALAHAHATQITVELQLHANALRLSVVDNGQGSAPDTWAHGLGLGGIRKRVKQLGGTVRWQECPSGGIRCEVMVAPFMPAQPDPSGAMPPAV